MHILFAGETETWMVTLEVENERLKPLEAHVVALQTTLATQDVHIATLGQSVKRLQERVDMPPPNE